MALGPGPCPRVPARTRRRASGRRADLQPDPSSGRRPGDRRPDRVRPERSLPRNLGAQLANGGGPRQPGAIAMAVLHRPVRTCVERALRRPPAALGGGQHAADGRRGTVRDARAQLGRLMPSRRDQIKLTAEELDELIETERIVVVSSLGPRGWPHTMPLWYVPRGGDVWIWTYAKSQKVRNLERDPRATLLIETGEEYGELRGVQIEAEAEITRDLDQIVDYAKEMTVRYSEGISAVEGDAEA